MEHTTNKRTKWVIAVTGGALGLVIGIGGAAAVDGDNAPARVVSDHSVPAATQDVSGMSPDAALRWLRSGPEGCDEYLSRMSPDAALRWAQAERAAGTIVHPCGR